MGSQTEMRTQMQVEIDAAVEIIIEASTNVPVPSPASPRRAPQPIAVEPMHWLDEGIGLLRRSDRRRA